MMKRLLLTGGSGEIGSAIKEKFLSVGYDVVAPARAELDLSTIHSIEHFLENHAAPIDAFIHCAGFNEPKPFEDIHANDFDHTMMINARSFYQLAQGLLKKKLINKNAALLGISSIYSVVARKKRFSYVASKHCLNGMIKTLALELAPMNIKVNTLSPGFVGTKMTYKNNSQEVIDRIIKKIPLGRMALPSDIAETAYYLCSDENRYITGQNIVADGGYTMGGFEE